MPRITDEQFFAEIQEAMTPVTPSGNGKASPQLLENLVAKARSKRGKMPETKWTPEQRTELKAREII